MPLTIKSKPEPWTERAAAGGVENRPILATSRASERLKLAMLRYVRGEIAGRAYLISGHRGSGKSTLVYNAVAEVLDQLGSEHRRPLLVRLNGPDLLRADPIELRADPIEPSLADDQPASPPVAKPPPADGNLGDAPPAKPPLDDAETHAASAVHVLSQITIGLYKAIADEVSTRVRRRLNARGRSSLNELAALIRLELDGAPADARLRELWQLGGFLPAGVLFDDARAPDQGMLELIALSSASQAYQVVTHSSIQDSRTQSRKAIAGEALKRTDGSQASGLTNALFSLLVGGTVTAAASNGTLTLPSALAGVATSLIAMIGLNYTFSRSLDQTSEAETKFVKDRRPSTLSRMLPDLVNRLRDAGLVPIFVVDELDKLDDLERLLERLVERLKHFVTERSFFCFLTDRGYFEQLVHESRSVAYPKAYTYFSDRLLVVYRPEELKSYLNELIARDASNVTENDDAEILAYVLRQRARLHPFDLRRQIDRATDSGGNVTIAPADLRSRSRYRFDVNIQVGVEWLLAQPELRERCVQDPDFLHYAYDALYYASRAWERGEAVLDLGESKFRNYLEQRLKKRQLPNDGRTPPSELPLTPSDLTFLRLQAWLLAGWLLRPTEMRQRLEQDKSFFVAQPVLEMFPAAGGALLVESPDGPRFQFDFHGQPLTLRTAEDFKAHTFAEAHTLVESFRAYLTRRSVRLDPAALASDFHLLPETPAWTAVAKAWRVAAAVIREGDLLGQSRTPHDATEAYRDVDDYADKLRRSLRGLALAFFCGRVLGTIEKQEGAETALLRGLQIIDRELQPAKLDIDRTRAQLERIVVGLPDFLPALPRLDPRTLSSDFTCWAQQVDALLDEPLRLDTVAREEITAAVWRTWTQRFSALQPPASPFDRDAVELLVSVLDPRPPSTLLRDPLSDTTNGAWSTLLCEALSTGYETPAWVAPLALQALGFTEATKEVADKLIQAPDRGPGASLTVDEWQAIAPALDWLTPQVQRSGTTVPRAIIVHESGDPPQVLDWKPDGQSAGLLLGLSRLATFSEHLHALGLEMERLLRIDAIVIGTAGARASETVSDRLNAIISHKSLKWLGAVPTIVAYFDDGEAPKLLVDIQSVVSQPTSLAAALRPFTSASRAI